MFHFFGMIQKIIDLSITWFDLSFRYIVCMDNLTHILFIKLSIYYMYFLQIILFSQHFSVYLNLENCIMVVLKAGQQFKRPTNL